MPDQEARGKPGQGYSFDQRGASNPEQSWSHTSHQERVEAVRAKLQERLLRRKAEFPKGDERYFPVEEVQFMVKNQMDTMVCDRQEFWEPVLHAWDALAYQHYQPGSYSEYDAGYRLSRCYDDLKNPKITLSPAQISILDTLSDAVGIQRRLGERDIDIPEKLRAYEQYAKSTEYKN
jgi:hypothetical protein